ncbi:hypothetical protein RN001_002038 [Aquatica leii]|uniref:Transcription factor Adf-1 n=1 Tax=Aquatica leii TaxID=1421715 RepID=A0AAN7SJW8_9COLE|nr:hypothetical protein RN001_002038 [Aquatica leii]
MNTTSRFRSLNNVDLIQSIKIRRALWDKELWDRIDAPAREIIWDDVAEQMKTTKEIVKTRWKNLRDSYRRLLMRAMGNPQEVEVIKWRYFHDMNFIKDIILNTKSKVSDISIQSIENSADNDTHEDPLLLNNEIDIDDIKVENGTVRKIINLNAETSSPYMDSDMDLNRTDSNERVTSSYPNDDDLQFLLSLYPHFKQVSLSQKLPLRIKIEKLIYEQLYGETAPY